MPLVIKPPRRELTASHLDPSRSAATILGNKADTSRSQSPDPPPASPLTPTIRRGSIFGEANAAIGGQTDSARSLCQQPAYTPTFIDQPPSLPFSGEDATDAIALRAAISSLQFQKQRAEQHIKTLQDIKRNALARPDEFQDHVVRTALEQQAAPSYDFTFGEGSKKLEVSDGESDDGDLKVASRLAESQRGFAPIPRPQEVVRCPPINWAKYHIVGEPLDQMHNLQQNTAGAPNRTPRSEHRISATYDPALDPLQRSGLEDPAAPVDKRKDSRGLPGHTPKAARSPAKASGRR